MYKGKIVKIVGDEAIVMVKDYELIRIKRRDGMTVGEEVEFSTEDIIFNFARISDFQGKDASEDDNVKDCKTKMRDDNVKGFTVYQVCKKRCIRR